MVWAIQIIYWAPLLLTIVLLGIILYLYFKKKLSLGLVKKYTIVLKITCTVPGQQKIPQFTIF